MPLSVPEKRKTTSFGARARRQRHEQGRLRGDVVRDRPLVDGRHAVDEQVRLRRHDLERVRVLLAGAQVLVHLAATRTAAARRRRACTGTRRPDRSTRTRTSPSTRCSPVTGGALVIVTSGAVRKPLSHSNSAGVWSRVPNSATAWTRKRCVPYGTSVYVAGLAQGVKIGESSAHSKETPVPEKVKRHGRGVRLEVGAHVRRRRR